MCKVCGKDSDKKPVKKRLKSFLKQEIVKYADVRSVHKKTKDGKHTKGENSILAAFKGFHSKLKNIAPGPENRPAEEDIVKSQNGIMSGKKEPGMEVSLLPTKW